MSTSDLRWQPFAADDLHEMSLDYGSLVFGGSRPIGVSDKSVVLIGAFDGLHIGHRFLVRKACEEAKSRGVPCIAVTFDPDPVVVLLGRERASGNRLLRCKDRVAGLLEFGVDAVYLISFDEHIAHTRPQDFVESVLIPCVRPLSVHVGKDFRFGSGGSGDVELLANMGAMHGFAVHGYDLVRQSGVDVSATRVRKLLRSGSLDEAQQLLGRSHYLRGVVEHGRGEGTSFGFPTANIRCSVDDCLPAEGVYACYVSCEGYGWPAAANVGAPPSFTAQDETLIEANLIGFCGDLYGKEVSISFVRWLRAKRVFSTLEELEGVVLGNIDWVSTHLGSGRLEVGRD